MSNKLGFDRSGNYNNFTVTNLAYSDQMLDTPTNNFCTMNPIASIVNAGTYSEGNLKQYGVSACMSEGTMAVSSGKWYYEALQSGDIMVGAGVQGQWATVGGCPGCNAYGVGCHEAGNWHGEDAGGETTCTAFADGALIGLAFDVDAQKIWMSVNGTWSGADPSTGNNAALFQSETNNHPLIPALRTSNDSSEYTITNFGQDSSFAGAKTAQGNQDSNGIGDFYYTPPTDFLALCTSNLPAVAVIPSANFNTILFDDGAGAKTGVGFQPDLVWVKSRGSGNPFKLTDSVRGVTKSLECSETTVEATDSTGLTAFGSDGFTVGADTDYSDTTGDGMVVWNWLANGSGSANTDGDMAETVTVSANTDAGFSIVTYTGDGSAATVGHGLSKAPEMIIIKNRDATDDWRVYHSGNTAAPETDYIEISTDVATSDDAENWNDTAPTADVFTIGDGDNVNTDDETYVAYCFHSVDGYSKVGSYTGNGSTDGTFIYTGFRPTMVIMKVSSAVSDWRIMDNKRDTYNPNDILLFPSSPEGEATSSTYKIDFLSNGFKQRNTHAGLNTSSSAYIYIAFAETPFKYSNAR